MIQPPKISPVGLACAGIGTTRSAGSQSVGSRAGSMLCSISVPRIQLVELGAMLLEPFRAPQLERWSEHPVVDRPRRSDHRDAADLRVAQKLFDLHVDALEHQLLGLWQPRRQGGSGV